MWMGSWYASFSGAFPASGRGPLLLGFNPIRRVGQVGLCTKGDFGDEMLSAFRNGWLFVVPGTVSPFFTNSPLLSLRRLPPRVP